MAGGRQGGESRKEENNMKSILFVIKKNPDFELSSNIFFCFK